MQQVQAIDPGFAARRVKRPNPMQKWDEETQANIRKDFDALLRELVAEHKDAQSKQLDNQYASDAYEKFKADEKRGRELLKSRFGPVSFVKGSFLLGRSRFALFCLGHEVLHGSYTSHPDPMFTGRVGWEIPLFILDKHWEYGHNRFHHKTPGVFGLDPESSPTNQRGSNDFYAEKGDRIARPISMLILAFHTLFFIGIVEAKKVAEVDENAWKDLFETIKKLAKTEFVSMPMQAGLNAPRVFAGNAFSFFFAEVISGILGRSTHIRDDSVCLHINEYDPSNRAHFYINSLLNAGNIDYPFDRAYIGGFDKHIEHHLFPFLSSRKLDEASARVRALCEKYDLPYKEGSLGRIMLEAIKLDLKTLFAA
jgi:linoleoyl-CoA desaturase